ncbi:MULTISPECIES: SDR family NAD(P)-dependent oxidoreductase [Methanobacterium]|jgi:NAD(P)-dependent dehydrogenase (short-subunit alcohol dehydrogenase family)|uniref:Short-chain dehydrogenase n=1 Tax=Methanobacterium bryantii TaxID=2161 RepID=A0A2A2H1Q9_METBR|nr:MULTISPECIES: SDR family oxidoreductase [Methanobacterium]OEC86323.1 short-chain dehydrogenase [Methanobacterium sp. A39]PAV03226.1 short-chain dehydrogenase [Methanobacterium bryantii]
MKLENKVVLVNGASSGIRNEVARLFAKEGASVVVVLGADEKLGDDINQISDSKKIIFVSAGDDNENIQSAINAAVNEFGKLDIILNCAGIADIITPVLDIGEGIWEIDFSVDVTGAI